MVNKERLEQLSSPVIEIYNAMEADMLENIAKRLADDKSLLDSNVTEWQFQKLNQLNGLNNENLRLVARQSGVSEREIKEALRKAGFEGIEGNEEYMEEALKNGVDLTQPPPLAEDNAILDILRAYQDQAEDTLNLVNSTILDSSEQAYRNIVNRSVAESLTGVKSSEQTIRDSVRHYPGKDCRLYEKTVGIILQRVM
nr:phage minor capsid protein [Thalassobacillus sp. C254]